MKNKVEVILTTYNGEKYLAKQLESITEQTCKEFTLKIYDDCSSDSTEEIILNFIEKNKSLNCLFIKNKKNLGWKKNFIEALKKSDSDYILFCDQDDLWEKNHISKIVSVLQDYEDANVVCSNYVIIDENDKITDSKKNFLFDDSVEKIAFKPKNFEVQRPGCSYGVRRTFIDEYLGDWDSQWAHDEFVWYLSIVNNSLFRVNFESLKYRRHGENASGFVKSRSEQISRLESKNKCINFLISIKKDDPESVEILRKLENFTKLRIEQYEKKNIILLLKYMNFFPSWKHFILEIKNVIKLRR